MSYYYTQVFKRYQPKLVNITGSIDELYEDFKKTNFLICGESHGVRENADLAYTLCKRLGIRRLAIERSAGKFAPFVQSAIAGKPNFLLPQVLLSLQASVLSLELLKTIVTLIKEQVIDAVEYVDLDSKDNPALNDLDEKDFMRAREREIAKNILKLGPSTPTIVLLGNYHTRQDVDKTVGQSALQIVREARSVTYLQYRYLGGSQYNAGRLMHFREARPSQNKSLPNDYTVTMVSQDNFVIEIPKAHKILI